MTMSNTLNTPAFPVSVPGFNYSDGSFELPYVANDGMSLRDYFAAQALAGLLLNMPEPEFGDKEKFKVFATEAYCLADAMLSARVKNFSLSDDPNYSDE